jgi:phage terminase small subunit
MLKVSRRKRYQRGKPNRSAELQPVPDTKWGPAMAALNDRARAFVLNLFSVKPGHGAAVRAAKAAGFGTTASSPQSWASIGSRLMHDEDILRAVREHSERVIKNSAPRAINALLNLIEDPISRDHARAIGMLMDRVHPAETHHQVDVTHTHITDHTAEAVAELRILRDAGVPREKLVEVFGFSGISRYERLLEEQDRKSRKLIESTVVEVVEPAQEAAE